MEKKQKSDKEELQSWALRLRALPGVPALYQAWYALAQKIFCWFAIRSSKRFSENPIRSIYLRRGAGRGETVPAASDLDFFLVIRTIPAQTEMEFLKDFWERYNYWRRIFPFLGEVLMGDENEIRNWVQGTTVRSFEAPFSWTLLFGEELLPRTAQGLPDARDEFSEALKCYWALLQPVLKLKEEKLKAGLQSYDTGAVHLRHAAKAAVDLFKIHYGRSFSLSEKSKLWQATRIELLNHLPKEIYGEQLPRLENLLLLKDPLFSGYDPFELFADLVTRAYQCIDELAINLESLEEEKTKEWTISYHSKRNIRDSYSYAVRELFAERILFRHQDIVARSILSEATAHLYFVLNSSPTATQMRELLLDLRDVSFSFDRFSVPMPLSQIAFKQLERTSLLDTPFHSYYAHHDIQIHPEQGLQTHLYQSPEPRIPWSMLQKTFTELNFALRFPPNALEYLVEHMLSMVLSLRLGLECGILSTDLEGSIDLFQKKFPTRGDQLRQKIGPYLSVNPKEEEDLWSRIDSLLGEFDKISPQDSENYRAQLQILREKNRHLQGSATQATDLWVNLTPFFRMEMNALKDRFFTEKPSLRI